VAIYHFSAQVLGRGKGRRNLDGTPRKTGDNAVKAAAYRAGSKLTDRRTEATYDYSHRRGVAHAEIIAPHGTAEWLTDRDQLWNAVERMEGRRDAQLAREINIALPHQLGHASRVALVRNFVREQFVSLGMVADVALHNPVPEKGDDPRNVHAHVMLTLRKATRAGLHTVKTREWNARVNLERWRAAWQDHVNLALEREGHMARVDHRTLMAQRADAVARGDRRAARVLDRQPEIHVGPRPKAMNGRKVTPTSRPRAVGAPRERWVAVRSLSPSEAAQAVRILSEKERAGVVRTLSKQEQRDWERQRRRRVRDYPRTDKGPRIGKLWDILTGNNLKAKQDIARYQKYAARFSQWMDYYDRKATWYLEGQIKGAAFRRERWLKAQAARQEREMERLRLEEAKRKAEHARKRAEQLRELTNELRSLVAILTVREESGLRRALQVAGWGRVADRADARDNRGGRARMHSGPSGPSGWPSGGHGGNPPAW
jgi:hypothetical protein